MIHSDSRLFITVWEFQVNPENRRAFERAYCADGDWGQLFRCGPGYIRTELHHHPESSGRYVTIDLWESKPNFENFKQQYVAEYNALDAKCEPLTEQETFIGEFATFEQARRVLSAKGLFLSSHFAIRNASSTDIPAMVSLESSVRSAAHWSVQAYEGIFNPEGTSRIALVAIETSGTLCGFVIARISSDECELENIVVADAYQRRGIGGTLMDAVVNSARTKGVQSMLLEVRESNLGARGLYENSGFTVSNRRKGYYSGPVEDALIYVLKLNLP